MIAQFFGSFVGGRFVAPTEGARFASEDPARPGEIVLEAVSDPAVVDRAVVAARAALPAWRRLSAEARVAALLRVKDALPRHVEPIAQAITAEMGKTLAESRAEAQGIARKIDDIIRLLPTELPPAAPGAPGEQRFLPLGVVAVIGPYNFPVHLLNTHVVPALLTGNTVVVKPSEVTPLAGQRFAELFADAALPDGVFNLVQGAGAVGAALVAHPGVGGVVFTGGVETGRRIRQATFDQPWKLVSLELGGKNVAIVLDDADAEQAAREIVLGALLTTGQRCTATSRVIVTPGIAGALRGRLVDAFSRIAPGDPTAEGTFMGPLATRAAHERFLREMAAARDEGARVLVDASPCGPGFGVTPGLHEVSGTERIVREELFGPHVAFEVAAGEDDAFARAAGSPYGLSASLFSARRAAFDRFIDDVQAGVLNFNRSTNNASGLLPFGGVGLSGNFRPSGSMSPRLCTVPVAVMEAPFGARTSHRELDLALQKGTS